MSASIFEPVAIDIAGAAAWAKQNGVKVAGAGSVVGRINAARAAMQLPPFEVHENAMCPPMADAEKLDRQFRRDDQGKLDPKPAALVKQSKAPAPIKDISTTETPGTAAPTPPIAASQDELLTLVTTYKGTRTGMVTPEIAGWLLALNTGNRPLSKANVDRFVAILQAGTWMNTGEPCICADTGQLNEGQHRLTAIQRSGIPAVMDVRFGIERAAFAATGTGTRRTAGNVLSIAGMPHASMQAAIARLMVHHKAGQMHRANQQVEGAEVVTTAQTEPAIARVAALIIGLKFRPTRTAPFGFVLVLAAHEAPFEDVETFARDVAEGKADEENATRRLHVRLRDAAMEKERLHQVDLAVLTLRAWNAWIERRPVQHLRVTDADRTGAGFPKIVGRAGR